VLLFRTRSWIEIPSFLLFCWRTEQDLLRNTRNWGIARKLIIFFELNLSNAATGMGLAQNLTNTRIAM
jgi:hypothetical protein